MHKNLRLPLRCAVLGLGLGVLASCVSPGPREREAAALARYTAHAGEPVESFHLRLMREWVPLGERHLAVYTSVNEAWLLEIEQPCPGLDFAQAVQLTSNTSRVYARFDSVRFDHQQCRIREIRGVDVRAMKAERRAQSRAGGGA